MSGRSPGELPRFTLLTPRQQMAIECVRCARRLGASGRVLGEVHHHERLFRLWVCVPDCVPDCVPRTREAW
ncbi:MULTISPECIES: hypothetical protein [unclassified Streptomyces]|uniref:hypothetical protein n=1 Tax=unclassified Streptomyces TaxID=2593676 RepID=UPI00382F67D2